MPPVFFQFSAIAFFFGAVIGSFLNVVVWRIPRGESVISPPSHCPKCGHRIRPWENIPIVSWLCLKGRCSGCGQPISMMYPLGEAAVGALYWLVFWRIWRNGLPLGCLVHWWCLAGIMLSLARIDARHGIIPRCITRAGMILASACNFLFPASGVMLSQWTAGDGLTRPATPFMRALQLPVHALVPAPWENAPWLAGFEALLLAILAMAVVYWMLWLYARAAKACLKHAGKTPRNRCCTQNPLGGGDLRMAAMTAGFLGVDAVCIILCTGAVLAILGAFLNSLWKQQAQAASSTAAFVWTSVPLAPYFAAAIFFWMMMFS